jgi:hypothetical protein
MTLPTQGRAGIPLATFDGWIDKISRTCKLPQRREFVISEKLQHPKPMEDVAREEGVEDEQDFDLRNHKMLSQYTKSVGTTAELSNNAKRASSSISSH